MQICIHKHQIRGTQTCILYKTSSLQKCNAKLHATVKRSQINSCYKQYTQWFIHSFNQIIPLFQSDVFLQHPPSHDLCCEALPFSHPTDAWWSPRRCWPCLSPVGNSFVLLALCPALLAAWRCVPPAKRNCRILVFLKCMLLYGFFFLNQSDTTQLGDHFPFKQNVCFRFPTL